MAFLKVELLLMIHPFVKSRANFYCVPFKTMSGVISEQTVMFALESLHFYDPALFVAPFLQGRAYGLAQECFVDLAVLDGVKL